MQNNIKNPAWYGGGMGMDMVPGAGNVFYVDGVAGLNTNDGLTPNTPKLTMTAALALCTANADDYIIVLDFLTPAGETWPISVNKDKVHIIGVNGAGTQYPNIFPAGDTAAFSIAADRVEIARLSFDGGANHACIEFDGNAARWGTHIRDCWLDVLGASQDGIKVEDVGNNDAVYMLVEGCRFGFAITRDGIRIERNATRCSIGNPYTQKGNLFDQVAGIGVNITGAAVQCGIYHNKFVVDANTAGGAITLGAGTSEITVDGNHAFFGDTTMGNNPYADGAGAGANHWGLNYQSDGAVMPS